MEIAKAELLKVQKRAHIQDIREEEQQRNKCNWVPNVDRNTRVSHMEVKRKRKKNTIEALKMQNNMVSDHKDVTSCLINHFSLMFKDDAQDHQTRVSFSSPIQLTAEQNKHIGKIRATEEVWSTITHIGSLKCL